MKMQRTSFVAGMVLGTALLLIRLAGARTVGDLFLTVGLTLAESSAVLMLERRAKRFEAEVELWETREKDISRAEALAQVAVDELRRRDMLCKDIQATIAEMEMQFELEHAVSDLKGLTSMAVAAIRSGYYAAIAANSATRRGLTPWETA